MERIGRVFWAVAPPWISREAVLTIVLRSWKSWRRHGPGNWGNTAGRVSGMELFGMYGIHNMRRRYGNFYYTYNYTINWNTKCRLYLHYTINWNTKCRLYLHYTINWNTKCRSIFHINGASENVNLLGCADRDEQINEQLGWSVFPTKWRANEQEGGGLSTNQC